MISSALLGCVDRFERDECDESCCFRVENSSEYGNVEKENLDDELDESPGLCWGSARRTTARLQSILALWSHADHDFYSEPVHVAHDLDETEVVVTQLFEMV